MALNHPTILPYNGVAPRIAPDAFIAAGCCLIGDVDIGAGASIWYNCVLRGDVNRIRVGARSNVQDGTVIHCDSDRDGKQGFPTLIGEDVLIGHMALLHGCTLHDRAFVGMGAIVMEGCAVESDAMLAAGAMLTPGKHVPSGQLWTGRPARYQRDLSATEITSMRDGPAHYVALAREHRVMIAGIDPAG